MRSSTAKKLISFCLALLLILGQTNFAISLDSSVNISLGIFNEIDVAFAVGQTEVDYSNFESDLKDVLSKKTQPVSEEDLNVIMGKKSVSTDNTSEFNWWTYDHALSSEPISDENHSYIELTGSQYNNDNNSKESHIKTSSTGSSMTFYGYGSSGYKDFKYLPDNQATKKTFEFSIEEGEAYDALDGVGFFFNTTINDQPYGSGQTMSGYLLFLQYNGSGKGQSMDVYKFNNIDTKAFHHINTSKTIAQYTSDTSLDFEKIATFSQYGDYEYRKFKVIVQPTELKVLYKGSSQFISGDLSEAANLVVWTQNGKTDKKVTYEKPENGGYGYGPMCGYRSHSCNRLTTLSLKDLTMASEKVRSLTEVVRSPNWRSNALKFIVNLNDNYIEDASNDAVLAELINRFNNEDIYYVGWGGGSGADSHKEILSKNNNKGTVVNTDETTVYANQIQAIADEIYKRYYSTTNNTVLTTDNVKFTVTGIDGEETDTDYPNGKWKISHSIEGFNNSEGIHELNDAYIKNLLGIKLNKPGTYTISYCGENVATITAHRRPIANFNFKINNNSLTFVDTSFDPDGRGNLTSAWHYQKISDPNSAMQDGKPGSLNDNDIYLVTLTATDEDGASSSITKQVSLNLTSRPFADFEISPDTVYERKPGSTVNLVNKSYSLKGEPIESKFVLKKGDTAVNYNFKEGDNDVSEVLPGDYKIELTVMCNGVSSEVVSRNFTVVEDSVAPSAVADPAPGTFSNNTDVTINFSDAGGSEFKEQRVVVTNSSTTPSDNATGWSAKSPNTTRTVQINKVGKSYIHYQAWDNKGNKRSDYIGPYELSKQNVVLNFSVTPSDGLVYPDSKSMTFTCTLNTGTRTEIPTGNVSFKIGNDSAGQANVANNEATLTYSPEINPGKYGPYTLTAIYSGDSNYKEVSKVLNNYYLTNKTQESLNITGLNSDYKYGETFEIGTSGGSGGGEITYTSSDTDVAIVDGSGNVEIVGVGEFTITAKKSGDDIFNEAFATSNVVIANKKDVTIKGLKAKNKTYNGNNTAEILGTPALSSIVDGDDVTINVGQATFEDENVGTGKAVTFSNFSLSGTDAGKYNLTAQPISTTANITKKDLKIDLKIKDKNYDGLNSAEYEEGPNLSGVIKNDQVSLNAQGLPTFSEISVGTHTIDFKNFSIAGEDAKNYNLVQPSDIKAEIKEGFDPILNTHYRLSAPDSNGWYANNDFVITPKEGYLIGRNNTDSGPWSKKLTFSNETLGAAIEFYIRDSSTKEISQSATESYKKDSTAPTGEIEFKGNKFTEFLNRLTFKFFFKEKLDVIITGKDNTSGINRIEYVKREEAFKDIEEAKNSGEWKNDKNLSGNSITVSVNPSEKFFIYAKIVDNAENYSIIDSDGVVLYEDATIQQSNIEFTKTSKDNIELEVNLNGNEVSNIYCSDKELEKGKDYDLENEKIIFNAKYLDNFAAGSYTLKISYTNPTMEMYGQEYELSDTSITCNIKKAKAEEIKTPVLEKVTYGTKLSEIALDDGWNWKDGTITPTVENEGYAAYYDMLDERNYDWSGIEGYDPENHRVERIISLIVVVDKSGWGKAIKNDGIINYVDKNGTTSVEVEEHGMIYLKEESDSTSAWYAIDNSEGIFEIGSRFWVRWLSKENDPDEWWYYYKNLDDEYKNSVDSGRLWIFLTGVTAPNGEEYTNFNANLPYYIELGEDWDEEDINAVFIGRGSDEIVDITYIYDMKYPAGKKEFAKLVLKHFSPYAIYDNLTYEERKEALENADVIETADHQMYFVKTGGNISMILKGAVILGAASILAIISLKKKRED